MLLGGEACPLGLSIQFVEAPEPDVIAALLTRDTETVSTPTGLPFPMSLEALLPFQAPWTRTLTATVGQWTALANNFVNGGDGTAPGPRLVRELAVRCVVATHAPRYGPGHAQTQLEIMGPGGEPPLMYIRSLSATATDGRWEWHESGARLPFEDTARYGERLKRDRFDRPMLLRYLGALGIQADDDAFGNATLHQQQVAWSSREVTLEEARIDFNR